MRALFGLLVVVKCFACAVFSAILGGDRLERDWTQKNWRGFLGDARADEKEWIKSLLGLALR